MGESSALLKRRKELPRSVALASAAAYSALFAGEEDGVIPGARLACRRLRLRCLKLPAPCCRPVCHACLLWARVRAACSYVTTGHLCCRAWHLPAATFEVIFMTGWAPHPGQQRPAQRGSATVSFEDLVKEFGEGGQPGSSGGSSSGGGDGASSPASGG